MPFFTPAYLGPEAAFNPFLQILSEVEKSASRANNTTTNNGACGVNNNTRRSHCGPRRASKTYSPRFDVRETETSYELHGDLPGVAKENISIEFTEPQTVVVRGHSERNYGPVTAPIAPAAVTTSTEQAQVTEPMETDNQSTHQATVSDEEDEFEDLGSEKAAAPTESAAPAPTAAAEEEAVATPEAEEQKPEEKYWFAERAVGKFERSFNFPLRVDQDGVKADLANGVLHVSIPKAKKHEAKRISVL